MTETACPSKRILLALFVLSALALPCADGYAATSPPGKQTKQQKVSQDREDAKRWDELDKLLSKQTPIRTLRASFEQSKQTPVLRKPLVSRGKVLVITDQAKPGDIDRGKDEKQATRASYATRQTPTSAPASSPALTPPLTRWDTQAPHQSVMTIDRRFMKLYYPKQGLVEVYPLQGEMATFAGVVATRDGQWKKRFTLRSLSVGEDRLVLRLLPRGDKLAKHVKGVTLTLDRSRGFVHDMTLLSSRGQSTSVTFKNVVINKPIAAAELTLKLPDGVRVVRPLGDDSRKAKSDSPKRSPRDSKGHAATPSDKPSGHPAGTREGP